MTQFHSLKSTEKVLADGKFDSNFLFLFLSAAVVISLIPFYRERLLSYSRKEKESIPNFADVKS